MKNMLAFFGAIYGTTFGALLLYSAWLSHLTGLHMRFTEPTTLAVAGGCLFAGGYGFARLMETSHGPDRK